MNLQNLVKTMQPPMTINRRQWLGQSAALGVAASGVLQPAFAAKSKRGILGEAAPRLQVDRWIDKAGKPLDFDVSTLEGQWVYMKCFQSWCPGCHKLGFPALQAFTKAFADESRVSIIALQTVFEGFGVNTEEKVRAMQLRYALPIVMGHDPGDPNGDHLPLTMREYRTGGTPWVVIIDPNGMVVYNDFHIDVDVAIAHIRKRLA